MAGVPRVNPGDAAPFVRQSEVSPYQGLSHQDVISAFVESRGGAPGIGPELSRRLVEHAGLNVDPASIPLMLGGVQVMADDGRSLSWADYVDWAGGRLSNSHRHSAQALRGVLGFLKSEPGTADYDLGKQGMVSMIEQNAQAS